MGPVSGWGCPHVGPQGLPLGESRRPFTPCGRTSSDPVQPLDGFVQGLDGAVQGLDGPATDAWPRFRHPLPSRGHLRGWSVPGNRLSGARRPVDGNYETREMRERGSGRGAEVAWEGGHGPTRPGAWLVPGTRAWPVLAPARREPRPPGRFASQGWGAFVRPSAFPRRSQFDSLPRARRSPALRIRVNLSRCGSGREHIRMPQRGYVAPAQGCEERATLGARVR